MNTAPIFPSGYLNGLREFCRLCLDRRHPRFEDQLALPIGLSACTGAIALHLAFHGGRRLLSRIRRHVSPSEPMSPTGPQEAVSLRGRPTPEDIEKAWDIAPRTLTDRLRIGSRLADLEPTLDNRFVFKKTRNGFRRIIARRPGMKGWMKKNLPVVQYSTAMHYKKLASRLRQLIGLDARIPLEWLLPDNGNAFPSLPASDRQAAAKAKAKLDRLLEENQKITHLTQAVESKLGIMRMVTIRRIQHPRAGREKRQKLRKTCKFHLICKAPHADFSVTADEARTQTFWDAVRKILGESAPDAETRRLQSDIRDWLNAPLRARHDRQL